MATASPNYHLYFPQWLGYFRSHQSFETGKTAIIPLWRVEALDMQVISFTLQGEAETWGWVLLIIWHRTTGRDSGERMCQISILALMCLVSHSPGVQKPLNKSLIFYKENASMNFLNCCIHGTKEGPRLPLLSSCWWYPHINILCIIFNIKIYRTILY